MDFYIGQVGIIPSEFWRNTWKENRLLGEAHAIKTNVKWDIGRYISAMIYNTKVEKRALIITPDKLFSLPHDIYLEKNKPKSTKEQFNSFMDKIKGKI